jgi:hypothetical protein
MTSRKMRPAGRVTSTGNRRGAYGVFGGEIDKKRPLGRPRHRGEDNIKMDLQDVGRGVRECIPVAQDRDRYQAVVNVIMNPRVIQNAGNFQT